MTIDQVQAILLFLQRTDIKGNEAPKFMECVEALQDYAKKVNENAD